MEGAASTEAELDGTHREGACNGEAFTDKGSSTVDATGEFCVEKDRVKSNETSVNASKIVAVSEAFSSGRTEPC